MSDQFSTAVLARRERNLFSDEVETLSLAPTVEERLQGLRMVARDVALNRRQGGPTHLDRSISALRRAAKDLGAGTAGVARFGRELMLIRREALEDDAIELLKRAGASKAELLGALYFLRWTSREKTIDFLESIRFDEEALESMRKNVVHSVRRLDPPPSKELGNEEMHHEYEDREYGTYKNVYLRVKKVLERAKSTVSAPRLSQEEKIPLWEAQWILEDLADISYLRRRCQAVRVAEGGHHHLSEIRDNWESLLKGPVLCIDCSTWFSVEPSEVFLAYERPSQENYCD